MGLLISRTRRTQNISKNQYRYPHQSRITLPSLLWDTLYWYVHILILFPSWIRLIGISCESVKTLILVNNYKRWLGHHYWAPINMDSCLLLCSSVIKIKWNYVVHFGQLVIRKLCRNFKLFTYLYLHLLPLFYLLRITEF